MSIGDAGLCIEDVNLRALSSEIEDFETTLSFIGLIVLKTNDFETRFLSDVVKHFVIGVF